MGWRYNIYVYELFSDSAVISHILCHISEIGKLFCSEHIFNYIAVVQDNIFCSGTIFLTVEIKKSRPF